MRIAAAFTTLLLCLLAAPPASADCTFGYLSEVSHEAGSNAGDMVAGHFNGDAYIDFAVVNRQSSNVAILRGEAGGGFADPTYLSLGATSQDDIETADLNADGNLDLIVSVTGNFTNLVKVFLGNGNATFTPGDTELVYQNPGDLALGDFDGDGKTDVVVTVGYYAGFNLLRGDNQGNLTQKSVNQIPTPPMEPTLPSGIATGDFDGDGKLDVAVSDIDARVWVWFGNGDGTFTIMTGSISTTTQQDHEAGTVTAGDYNGDGYDDLAVPNVNPYGNGIETALAVMRSNGANRTFGAAVHHGETYFARDAQTYDIDGDGDLDVVASGTFDFHIYRGNGDGTFTQTDLGSGGVGMALFDLDDDGGIDIAGTQFSPGAVRVMQNACGQVTLDLGSSSNPASYGTSVTLTASLTSNPAATGTLTLSQTGGGVLASTNLNAATSVSATLALEIGTYEFVATYTGDSRFPAKTVKLTQVVQTPPFGPPLRVTATSTGGAVQVTWIGTNGVDHYEIWRNSGTGYAKVGESAAAAFTDITAPSQSALLYKVRGISPSDIASAFSLEDATITHALTDESITATITTIKRVHLTELREAANALRALVGLGPAAWTDAEPAIVKNVHITELRNAVDEARTTIGLAAGTFTSAATPRRVHIVELRTALR